MTPEQKKKWKDDFESHLKAIIIKYPFNEELSLKRDNERYLYQETQDAWLFYLAARQEAQKEADSLRFMSLDAVTARQMRINKSLKEEIQSLKEENKKLVSECEHYFEERKIIRSLKKELKKERDFVDKIASQAINQKEYEEKGGEDYEETDHRGGYEYIVEDARQTQQQRKVEL